VPTLTFEPTLDESKQLLCIEHGELGIDVYAPTRETLLAELHEQLAMLWQEYAQASDDELDAPARPLKQALRARFTQAVHAVTFIRYYPLYYPYQEAITLSSSTVPQAHGLGIQ